MYNIVIVQGVNNVSVEVSGEIEFTWQDFPNPSELVAELTQLFESIGMNPTTIAEGYYRGGV